jgi:flavorubredoxin
VFKEVDMRALILYTSWFGQTRLIARALSEELKAHGITVVVASVAQFEPREVSGFAMMLLGTHTHTGQASRQLRDLCQAIPHHRLRRMAIGLFGTSSRPNQPESLRDLAHCLAERGCPPALPPLQIKRNSSDVEVGAPELTEAEMYELRAYVAELVEMCQPVAYA